MTKIVVTDNMIQISADDSGKALTCNVASIKRPTLSASRAAHLDALLDEALIESFPASDPIAISFESPDKPVPSSKESDDR